MMRDDDTASYSETQSLEKFTEPAAPSDYDRSRTGYKIVILGLFLSFFLAATAIGGCAYIFFAHRGFVEIYITPYAREAITLSLNVLVTAATDATGYLHSTTLRWTLAEEDRLHYNANLRLLCASKKRWCNGVTVNIIFAITLVLSYTSVSTLFVPAEDLHKDNINIVVSALPLGLLGFCILAQTLLAANLFLSVHVPTWSSNPITVAHALLAEGMISHRPNRCLRSVKDKDDPSDMPVAPTRRQPSIWNSNKHARRIVFLVWSLIPLGLIWAGIIVCITKYASLPGIYTGPDKSLFDTGSSTELDTNWTNGRSDNGDFSNEGLVWCLIVVAAIQCFATIALHCAELVGSLSRDESIWRRANEEEGLKRRFSPVVLACTSWQTVGLTLSKMLVHWLFGNALVVSAASGLVFYLFQIWYLTVFLFFVSAFVTYIAYRHPSGHQPTAYGHLQTLVDLIDEWPTVEKPVMFWGHKSSDGPMLCHAGTSTTRLLDLDDTKVYA